MNLTKIVNNGREEISPISNGLVKDVARDRDCVIMCHGGAPWTLLADGKRGCPTVAYAMKSR
jgi:hypothetical protein